MVTLLTPVQVFLASTFTRVGKTYGAERSTLQLKPEAVYNDSCDEGFSEIQLDL
jgi:hypothetical protein